jgi:uncharacterized protein (DUF58 family)
VALALAVLADWLRTPSPAKLRLSRALPSRAGLSREFERRITVGPAPALRLEVREEFPASWEVLARTALDPDERQRVERLAPGEASRPTETPDPTGGPDVAVLDPGRPTEVVRHYRAHLRGVHGVGRVRLRLRGPLGLIERQTTLIGRQSLAVEPALRHLGTILRLAANERWRELGVRVLPRRGGLTEFESLRDYVQGDDVRLVDWKAFAKRSKPAVRQYQLERGQEMLLLIDCGRRMGATTAEGEARGWTKLDHALDAALELAAVALQRGDRVGCLAFDATVRTYVPPRRGRTQLARLREALFDLLPSERDSDLGRALREASVRLRRRTLLLLLSDVADPLSTEEQKRSLARGSRNHRILFAALDDPALRAVVERRLGVSPSVRAAAFDLIEGRRVGLRALAGSGARVVNAPAARSAAPLLAAWLAERQRSS